MYERGIRVSPGDGTRALAGVVEPYFERAWDHFSSHKQTPGDKLSPYPAATLNGKVAYVSFPIFSAYAMHGNYPYRLLVRNLLNLLLPEPLLRVDAPTGTEATVMRQGERTVLHLLHYSAERRARDLDLIEDIVPLRDVAVSLQRGAAPKSVYLAPERTPLEFTYEGGRVSIVVPEVRGHAMIALE
jgi:hypothetical protein